MTRATHTCADFAAHLGSEFRIAGDAQTYLPVTLVEATPGGATGPERAFSLVFRSAIAQMLPQRVYALDHDTLGPLDLFLVPLRPVAGGVDYVATFT